MVRRNTAPINIFHPRIAKRNYNKGNTLMHQRDRGFCIRKSFRITSISCFQIYFYIGIKIEVRRRETHTALQQRESLKKAGRVTRSTVFV